MGRMLHLLQPEVRRKRPNHLPLMPKEQRKISRLKTGKTVTRTSHGNDQPAYCQTFQ
ncbi:hypothetical protein CHS0354_012980, partial [Potamilus streckersoni]